VFSRFSTSSLLSDDTLSESTLLSRFDGSPELRFNRSAVPTWVQLRELFFRDAFFSAFSKGLKVIFYGLVFFE